MATRDNAPRNSSDENAQHRSNALLGSNDTLESRQNDTANDPDGETDAGEQGKGSSTPPHPVGFWDKRLRKTRLAIYGLWARTTLMLSVFILAVLSLYWGVLFRVPQNLSSLRVYVVDFDGQVAPYTSVTPLLGPMVTRMTEEVSRSSMPHLGYSSMSPTVFDNDPIQVRQAVYNQKAWAAVIINPNATALLQQAVEQGNAFYDPLGACQVIWVEARDQDTHNTYILPELNSLETEITSSFGKTWSSMVLQNTSIPRANLQRASQALSPAIGFSRYNLRPFTPVVTTPAVTIGLIYLIIISFFSFSFFLPIHTKLLAADGHPPVKFWQFVVWRWVATIAAYSIMSLTYSLISLAFQIPFANSTAATTAVTNSPDAYGKGTFVVYWMINFVGMIAVGLACENVAMIIGQPWTAMWLIFWVITNVSTSFYALDLSPGFYGWGYAWPLHNIVEASRSTLFNLHSRIGLNFGVLFAWSAINSALFPLCCWFMRRQSEKEKKAKAEKGG